MQFLIFVVAILCCRIEPWLKMRIYIIKSSFGSDGCFITNIQGGREKREGYIMLLYWLWVPVSASISFSFEPSFWNLQTGEFPDQFKVKRHLWLLLNVKFLWVLYWSVIVSHILVLSHRILSCGGRTRILNWWIVA